MNTIDEYIKEYPNELQERLMIIKDTILEAEPTLKQKISWGMPTFYLKHNIIHFAVHKNHIGIYPGADAVVNFEEKLKNYKTSKGSIQIPNKQEIPVELIKQLVIFNVLND